MQIIQSIREKGAAIVIVVIAMSLIGFILMDAKQGGSSLFGSMSTSIGKINGETIELAEFNKRVKEAEDQQAQRSGQRPGGIQTYQIREQTWNQIVAERIFAGETQKLGIEFTAKELSFILLSNDPTNPFVQEPTLKDSLTGKLDIKKAQDALKNIQKSKGEQRDLINAQIVNPLKLNKAVAKYSALLNASAYCPKWLLDQEIQNEISFSSITYVSVPYSDIPDGDIKVSDKEVEDYVNSHKDLFKQEEGRNLSYITFSQLPSKEDSAKVFALVDGIKSSFQLDSNAQNFVSRNSSTIDFKDEFVPKSKISSMVSDTISKLAVGTVYGPYIDNGGYVLAKLLGSKQIPDSAKARHILIATTDTKTGQPLRTDTVAKKLADSIYNAITSGADFTMLALQFSNDDGSKIKGGDLGTFGYGAMVPEFNDFCFNKTPGSKGVVKTQFGYHVIDLITQKDLKPAYKIAYVAKDVVASQETVNKSSLDAIRASSEKTKDALQKYITKNGLSLTTNPSLVKENDYSVGALQDARSLVRWAFEASVGNVSEPFSIGDLFVVATLDKINNKGVQDATTARPGCEVIIRNQKKAAMITKKLGSNPTLESAAAAYGKSVQYAGADSTITFASQMINGIGVEAKIIGAAFNPSLKGKTSAPIEGNSGVYLVKVMDIQSKPSPYTEAPQKMINTKVTALRNQTSGWYEGLKTLADIKDERSKHF